MCGIAGIINLDGKPVSQRILKNMTNTIAHRGPDGEGHWIEGNIGIGHRRLSIIDISLNGKQPMTSSNGRFILSYNGEIYNFQELRVELERAGFHFNSKTDSEVVLYALIFWGKEALLKFNGMFALALWDRETRTLLLARDRYGIKPLYYAFYNKKISFASEQKAILADQSFKKQLNKPALLEYFTFQNFFTNQTLFETIKLLPSGQLLEYDEKEGIVNKQTYWDFKFSEPEKPSNKKEYLEELDRLFHQAVKRQLVGDVEVATYLSGGMDSGSITALAARHIPNIKTFTVGFDLSSASGIELNFDERIKAERIASWFKTEHYEMVLKSADMEYCLPNFAWHMEEPRVGQSYPNYYAAKLASKFVKVVLSGGGGDELFAGYPWRYYRAANSLNFEHFVDEYYNFWQRLTTNSEIKLVFSPIWKDVKDVWTRDIFRNVFSSHENDLKSPEDYINHSLYFEAKTFLHGLLVVEDKLSMAHGLENRVPFLDNDLVDFAMQCPVNLKLNDMNNIINLNENDVGHKKNRYFKKTKDGKQILRDAMSRYMPEYVTNAEKQGFSSPDASWFKGESKDFVRRTLLNKDAKIFDYFDQQSVAGLVGQHLSGLKNRRLFIWSLLNFEEYLRQFQ